MSAPSGARFPFSTTMPPVFMIGSRRTTSPSAPGWARSAASSVWPESVRHSPWRAPCVSRDLRTALTPPAAWRSLARKRPPGLRSAISGVRFAMRAKSSSVKRMPASCAMAGIWSAALVEPPVAATAAQAFSKLFFVTSWRGNGPPFSSKRITISPALRVNAPRCASTAGNVADPGSARPSVSATIAMVLAVNWPGHEPSVGRHTRSSCCSSASLISPASTAPTAS